MPIRKVGRLVLDRCVDNFFAETEQVAFCTNNIVPGVDFSNDPLLQGRNFSYLDTQLKRLGSPNFTHIPINAPKCPFATLQQDGHMAMVNPESSRELRTQFLGGGEAAVRARRRIAVSIPTPQKRQGPKLRVRSETFADHYSQARQFYISQTRSSRTISRRLVYLRAEQGREARNPRADGLSSAERRRGTWRKRSPRGWASANAEASRAPPSPPHRSQNHHRH